MKNLIMTAIATALAFANPAFADDAHHPARAPEANSAPAKPAAKTPQQGVKKMQDNVKKMQSQLDRIARAKTDEERRKALAEHLRTMQENMRTAHDMQAGMMDCPMMEGGMMGGSMGKGGMGVMGQNAQPGSVPDRMQQMEKRMDMMQMMMEQISPRGDGGSMPMK